MKVYLSGSVGGSYRAQNIIKALGDAGIIYFYMPTSFLVPKFKNRYLRKLVVGCLLLLTAPTRLFMLLLASKVIVLPMCKTKTCMVEVSLAKVFGKEVIVDYYISEYDTLVNDRKTVLGDSLRAKWLLFKDRFFLKSAQKVIFLNASESSYYQAVADVTISSEKISLIPLCIDYKRELFEAGCKRNDGSTFNVCWWGTYIPLHGLENLIEAFARIREKNIKLSLFGDSDEKGRPYHSLIVRLGLEKSVTISNNHSFANGRLAPFLKSECDLAIGAFGTSDKAKTVLVNKLVDALSLGIPCLTMATSASEELLPGGEGLMFTEPYPDEIAASIEAAYRDRADLKVRGDAGKRKYLDLFSPDAFKVNFLAVLHK